MCEGDSYIQYKIKRVMRRTHCFVGTENVYADSIIF